MDIDLSKLKPAKLPEQGERRCGDCKKWVASLSKRYHLDNQGRGIEVQSLLQQGSLPANANIIMVAPCSFLPMWQNKPSEDWCSQFEPRETH